MGFLVFIPAGIALGILSSLVLRGERFILWRIGIGVVGGLLVSINSISSSCRDGWGSSSIGRQGACSWHGGVTQHFTEYGWMVIGVSLIIIILAGVIAGRRQEKERILVEEERKKEEKKKWSWVNKPDVPDRFKKD